MRTTKFDIWNTVNVGQALSRTPDDFRRALPTANVVMTADAFALLEKDRRQIQSGLPEEVDLVVVSFDEFDFPIVFPGADFRTRAAEWGLALCPPCIALEAVLQGGTVGLNCAVIGSSPLLDHELREHALQFQELTDGRLLLAAIPEGEPWCFAVFILPSR